jgi:aspartate aminotransferase-like enzyme
MGAALDYIAAQGAGDLSVGRDALIDNAELCAEMTRAAAAAMGLALFSANPGAAATAILAPAGVDSTNIVKDLKSRFGAVIANGQGEMKGQLFRVAHLGFFDPLDTLALIGALEQTAHALGFAGFEFGAALTAAQLVYAKKAGKSYKSASQLQPELAAQ